MSAMRAIGRILVLASSLAVLAAGCGGGGKKDDGGGGGGGGPNVAPGPGGTGGTGTGGAAPGPGQSSGGGTPDDGGAAGGTTGGLPENGIGGESGDPPGVVDGGAADDPFIIEDAGGGLGDPGGSGPNVLGATCQQILQRFGHLSCAEPNIDSLLEDVCGQGPCLRDTYVGAAVVYCWAARCTPDASTAADYETCAAEQLCNANDLCSTTPGICPDPCNTEDLWACDTTTGIGESPVGGCPQSCPLSAIMAVRSSIDRVVVSARSACAEKRLRR